MNKVMTFKTQKVVGQVAHYTLTGLVYKIQLSLPEDIYNFKINQDIYVSTYNNPYLERKNGRMRVYKIDEEKQTVYVTNEDPPYNDIISLNDYLIDLEYEEKVAGPDHLKILKLESMIFEKEKTIKSLLYILEENDLLEADVFGKKNLNKDLEELRNTISTQEQKYKVLQKVYAQCEFELNAMREQCHTKNSPTKYMMKYLRSKIPFIQKIQSIKF